MNWFRNRELDYINQRLSNIEGWQRIWFLALSTLAGVIGLALINNGNRISTVSRLVGEQQSSLELHKQDVESRRAYPRLDEAERNISTHKEQIVQLINNDASIAKTLATLEPIVKSLDETRRFTIWIWRGFVILSGTGLLGGIASIIVVLTNGGLK